MGEDRSGPPNPMDVLKLYRQRSPVGMDEGAALFLKLSERHRSELLWYMLQHITSVMMEDQGAKTTSIEEAERVLRGGDA